jgi:hypothetical protein
VALAALQAGARMPMGPQWLPYPRWLHRTRLDADWGQPAQPMETPATYTYSYKWAARRPLAHPPSIQTLHIYTPAPES